MNHFTQHIPSYVTGVVPLDFDFETTEELVSKAPFLGWAETPGFYGFALCEHRVMALFEGGKKWYVIGFVRDAAKVDLPEWSPSQ